jgi:hypothetical protein
LRSILRRHLPRAVEIGRGFGNGGVVRSRHLTSPETEWGELDKLDAADATVGRAHRASCVVTALRPSGWTSAARLPLIG